MLQQLIKMKSNVMANLLTFYKGKVRTRKRRERKRRREKQYTEYRFKS